MMTILKMLFASILLTMLGVTSKAQAKEPIWRIPKNVSSDPWFIATLFDAYFGFITFYSWVFYKEKTAPKRLLWFVLIMLGGNMSMASYMLIQLFKQQTDKSVENLLLKK